VHAGCGKQLEEMRNEILRIRAKVVEPVRR
jgi:hypothetical protein